MNIVIAPDSFCTNPSSTKK